MNLEMFRKMADSNWGVILRSGEADRLAGPDVAPRDESRTGERVLLVRLDGTFFIETIENATVAASSDPDFVVAIPLSRLRPLINRSVN